MLDRLTQSAWMVHPEEQFVEIRHPTTDRQIVGTGVLLDGRFTADVLPGISETELANYFDRVKLCLTLECLA